MSETGRVRTLSAIAYVMIACAEGADGSFDAAEKGAIWRRLSGHASAEKMEDVEAALRDAVADYSGREGAARIMRLEEHLKYLHKHLEVAERDRVLQDLRAVAQSDGNTSIGERAFIDAAREIFALAGARR
jgi:tellurite resistance protein